LEASVEDKVGDTVEGKVEDMVAALVVAVAELKTADMVARKRIAQIEVVVAVVDKLKIQLQNIDDRIAHVLISFYT
jgi:hypothetical protein